MAPSPAQPQPPVTFSQSSQQTTAQHGDPEKPTWRRGVIWFIPAMGLITIIFLTTKIIKVFTEQAPQIPTPQNQTDVTPIYNYNSEWSETGKKFILKRNNLEILSFQLTEKPLEVVVNPFENTVAIVAAVDKTDKSSQNLYIYNSTGLAKIFIGKKFTVNEDDENLRNLPEKIHIDQFSPDGKYLLFSVNEWETANSFVVPTDTSNPVDLNQKLESPFGLVYWNQDGKCLLSINTPGMYGPSLMLGQFAQRPTFSYLKFNEKTDSLEYTAANDFDTNKIKVYWENDCSGLLYLEEDLQFKKSGSKPASAYFRFSPAMENTISEVPKDLEDYQQGFSPEPIILTPKYID